MTIQISRGFRRLSVLVGALGFLVFVAIQAADYQAHYRPATWQYITSFGLCVFLPVALVLLIGWVVAGFLSE
jgi:hypothetical protein